MSIEKCCQSIIRTHLAVKFLSKIPQFPKLMFHPPPKNQIHFLSRAANQSFVARCAPKEFVMAKLKSHKLKVIYFITFWLQFLFIFDVSNWKFSIFQTRTINNFEFNSYQWILISPSRYPLPLLNVLIHQLLHISNLWHPKTGEKCRN